MMKKYQKLKKNIKKEYGKDKGNEKYAEKNWMWEFGVRSKENMTPSTFIKKRDVYVEPSERRYPIA